MQTDETHAYVESWLDGASPDLPAPGLIALLERALVALWHGANVTLGEVTLTAIVDRVLFTASERYPFLSILKIEGSAIGFEIRQLGAVQLDRRLREVVRFVVAEFLSVLGNLTDEILTPALQSALSGVARRRDSVGDDEGAGGAAQ